MFCKSRVALWLQIHCLRSKWTCKQLEDKENAFYFLCPTKNTQCKVPKGTGFSQMPWEWLCNSENYKNIKAEQKNTQLALLWITPLSLLQSKKMFTKLSNCALGARESRTSWLSCKSWQGSWGDRLLPAAPASEGGQQISAFTKHLKAGALTKGPISQTTYPLEIKINTHIGT